MVRPPKHSGELPGEVVHVLDAGVETETGGRRETMGGVADQENATVLIAFRDRGLGPPMADLLDRDVDVGADQFTDLRHDRRVIGHGFTGKYCEVRCPFLRAGPQVGPIGTRRPPLGRK